MDNRTTFTLNGITYSINEKGNRFYKTFENGQKVRIGEAEFNGAYDKYFAEERLREDERDAWEQEADAEKKAREKKQEKDAKTAEKAVAKKRAKKNVAFEFEGTTLTEKQVKFLRLLPNDDFFENGLESTLWIDVLCDTLTGEFNPMALGAMVSTLREKDLIYVAEERVNGRKCKYFGFTEDGKQVARELGLK